jgi:hypothetical protein
VRERHDAKRILMKKIKQASAGNMVIYSLILANAIVVMNAFTKDEKWYGLLFVTIPMLVFVQMFLKKHR